MKNIFIKTITILCVVLLIINCVPLVSKATTIDEYINTVANTENVDDGGLMNASTKLIGTILNIIRIVGAAVAIVMLLFVATKYIMTSAGDRADIKKYAMNYVIGAMIFLGASGILTIIRDFILEG